MTVPSDPSGPRSSLEDQVTQLANAIGSLNTELVKIKGELANPGFFDFTESWRSFARFVVQSELQGLIPMLVQVDVDGITLFGRKFPQGGLDARIVRRINEAELRATRKDRDLRADLTKRMSQDRLDARGRLTGEIGKVQERFKTELGVEKARLVEEIAKLQAKVRLELNSDVQKVNSRINLERRARADADARLNKRVAQEELVRKRTDDREATRLESAVRKLAEAVRENGPEMSKLARQMREIEESLR
jgi:hypothetical protein